MKLKLKLKRVKAYTLSEVLIVLCIIGILLLMVMPNQTAVVSQAKAIEAQTMLNHVFGLQQSYFYRHSKYATSLEQLGFEPGLTVDQGGQAVYKISIESATNKGFTATARSVTDLDADGNMNTWKINELKELEETVLE